MKKMVGLVGVGVGSYAAATYLGATWGSTLEERARVLPTDDLVPDPMVVTNHAITIRGGAEDVWPWLVQVGWHRAGWYTYRWVDRLLFPENRPSADEILPELQGLSVGEHIPDGAPDRECYFVVERMDRPSLLLLHSRSHLPPWPQDAWLDWIWTYVLEDRDDEVRVLLRTRASLGPAWLAAVYRASLWTDFVMARSHLQGIKSRVESHAGVQRIAADGRYSEA